MSRRKTLNKLLLCLFLVILLVSSYQAWLPLPAKFLLVEDNIQKVDCVVPLRGDDYWRLGKTAELYKAGYARSIIIPVFPERNRKYTEYYNFKLLVSGVSDISEKVVTVNALSFFGIGLKDVYFTDLDVYSFYDEAIAVRSFMLKRGMKSMILVSSTYNTRRAFMIFKWVFKGTGIKVYPCTAINEFYDPLHWWRKEADAKIVLYEYISLAYNIIYRFIIHRGDRPALA